MKRYTIKLNKHISSYNEIWVSIPTPHGRRNSESVKPTKTNHEICKELVGKISKLANPTQVDSATFTVDASFEPGLCGDVDFGVEIPPLWASVSEKK